MAFQASSIGLWREENRAPVFPERVNRWLLGTTIGDTSAEIGRALEAAIRRDVGSTILGPSPVRGFRVVELSTDPSEMDFDAPIRAGVGGLAVGPKPDNPPGSVFAVVEFAWDSPRDDVAWLSERVGLFPFNTFRNPDTLLVAVFEPGGRAPTPSPDDSIFDDLSDFVVVSSAAPLALAVVGAAALYLSTRKG